MNERFGKNKCFLLNGGFTIHCLQAGGKGPRQEQAKTGEDPVEVARQDDLEKEPEQASVWVRDPG